MHKMRQLNRGSKGIAVASAHRTMKTRTVLAIVAAALAGGFYVGGLFSSKTGSGLDIAGTPANAQGTSQTPGDTRTTPTASDAASIELNDKQLASVKVERVDEREFPVEKGAVGNIDFNEELLTQVFAPYQGRIIGLFAKVGDEVKKGQTLFTIDSPDLLNADSNLIAAAGVLDLTTRNLARLRKLYETRAVSQHDVEQAVSDQQTAEGALRAGRDAVRIFGKTDAEIDLIVKERKADPTLVVPSPISGRITARNAAPGLFVQPGSAPAPFTVADISTMWMLANVAEWDVPAFHIGQEVKVSVVSFPGEIFEGHISTMDSMVDPNSRRLLVRSEIADPKHELRSGMFATFVIRVGNPMRSAAVPLDGVVREGDGTMTVWVTTDRRRFTQRVVKIGMQKNGFRQILEGLQPGELIAGEGAVFLSNMLVIGQAGG
jgi:cobalt-zinc-cadmium efflux system membrane fusion protein